MDVQVESLLFQLQQHRNQGGGQGPCSLTRRTAIALHWTSIRRPSPSLFLQTGLALRPRLPPPNFLPVLSPSILDRRRPTRVSRPPRDGALHLRYNFAWAAFISSLSSTRARDGESASEYSALREGEREAFFFGNTSFFTRESGDVGTMLPLRALPTLSLSLLLYAWTWPRS